MHNLFNSVFSPPGHQCPMLVMPANVRADSVVISLSVLQFRADFPLIALRLDAMRQKSLREGAAGGREA